MRRNYLATALVCALACTSLGALLTVPARASLGGGSDSVSADSSALRGQLRSVPYVQYDVQEITTGPLVIHEYVTRSGHVFAVTWQGPIPPNLQQLLGTYFGEYQSLAIAAQKANPGIRRQLMVSQPDLVVQSVARMRDYQGLAYVPALVPAGVSVNQLQ